MNIARITAQELLDSRGQPTVEATVCPDGNLKASGMVPSGASTGKLEALEKAGYTPGVEFMIALDPAASELYRDGRYYLEKDGLELTSAEMVDLFVDWTQRYPIVSIEDGLDRDDWEGFALLKRKTQNTVQIVGYDLFVTNPERIAEYNELMRIERRLGDRAVMASFPFARRGK